jgi:ABC-type enterobactin transport system permease subunit
MDLVSMSSPQQFSFVARNSLALSVLVFMGAALVLPWVGAGPISLARVLRHEAPDYDILVQLRISRTLLALVAGGALSLAGALFQAMLRDALATPYTLGISAGASLDLDWRVGRRLQCACPGDRWWVQAEADLGIQPAADRHRDQ